MPTRTAQARVVRPRSRPTSTRFEPVVELRDVNAGSSRTPFRHACRTWAVWQYQPIPALSRPLPTLPRAPAIRLPPASRPLLRQQTGEGLPPPLDRKRLVAHLAVPPPASHFHQLTVVEHTFDRAGCRPVSSLMRCVTTVTSGCEASSGTRLGSRPRGRGRRRRRGHRTTPALWRGR